MKHSVDSHTIARAIVMSIRKYRKELATRNDLTPAQKRHLARMRGVMEWGSYRDGYFRGRKVND